MISLLDLLTALGVFGNLAFTIALWQRKPVATAPEKPGALPAHIAAVKAAMTTRYRLASFAEDGSELAPLYAGDDDKAMASAYRTVREKRAQLGDFVFLDARCRTHRGRITRR